IQRGRHRSPLLLRLPRTRRPGRRGRRSGPRGANGNRHDQRDRLFHEPCHLGSHDDRPDSRMSAPPGSLKIRRRLAGLVFLLVIALLAWLSVALYDKTFTPVAMVTLYTGSAGNEMHPGAQVMVRGVQVGEVRQVSANGSGARLELAIQPGELPRLPANVSAEMLPTTLFGERYVDLILPARPAEAALADGSVILQDR